MVVESSGNGGQAEFDAVASEYERQHAASIRLSGEDTGFFAEYKIRDMRKILAATNEVPRTMLDFGSGIGNSAGIMAELFPDAQLICADVSERSLDICRERHGSKVITMPIINGSMTLRDQSVDVAFTACVFHHIPEDEHLAVLAELKRVIRTNGSLFLFEHNPWNPLTRHAVASCPFDRNAVLISAPEMKRRLEKAGFRDVVTRYRIFFPGPLAIFRGAEALLTKLPLGAQYSLHARA